MKQNIRRIRVFALHLLAVLIVVAMVPEATAAFKYLHEGMKAPDIVGKNLLTGEDVSTESLGDGKMVVILFWATWSKRSMEQLVDLKEIAVQYQDHPISFVAVNVENEKLNGPMRQLITDTIQKLELPFPSIIDEGLAAFKQFGVIAVPSTAILDTTRTLRYGPAGYSLSTRDRIVDSIEVLLGLKDAADTVLVMKTGYEPKKRASRYYYLALNLFNKRMYERALSNLEMAQSFDSGFPAIYGLKGEIYLKIDSVDRAKEQYAIAVSLDSVLISAVTGLGIAQMESGDLESALMTLTKAFELDETFTPAVLNLGLCLSRMGNNEEALKHILQALELNFGDASIHYFLGQVYLNSADQANAAQSYQKALEILYPAN